MTRFIRRAAIIATLMSAVTCSSAAAAEPVYRVNSTEDAVDASPGDGICAAANGRCTLRAAMMEAERHPLQTPTVAVPAGNFLLTRPAILPGKGTSEGGGLVALWSVNIRGAGARKTIINANGVGSALSNVNPLAHMTVSDLTITGGLANETPVLTGGGGIWNEGTLTVERVTVTHNRADYAGGIFNTPTAFGEIRESTISYNIANTEAGGIRFDAAGLLENSTVTGNEVLASCCTSNNSYEGSYAGEGGGVDARAGGEVDIVNSTIVGNHATTGGGGVNIATAYTGGTGPVSIGSPMTLRNTIVANNTTDTGPANCSHTSAPMISRGHNLDSDGGCSLTAAGDKPGVNPRLTSFGNHGGPTNTFNLQLTSPAINGAAGCPPQDQRGVARRPYPCDTGSVERVP